MKKDKRKKAKREAKRTAGWLAPPTTWADERDPFPRCGERFHEAVAGATERCWREPKHSGQCFVAHQPESERDGPDDFLIAVICLFRPDLRPEQLRVYAALELTGNAKMAGQHCARRCADDPSLPPGEALLEFFDALLHDGEAQ